MQRKEQDSVVAKPASKRPVAKAEAHPSKPAHKPSVNKASSTLAKKAAKSAPTKRKPVEKPSGKANGTTVAKAKRADDSNSRLGGSKSVSVFQRTASPGKARKPVVNGEPVEAPVPSNNKPRKNQAGLNSRELDHFRDLLLAKRGEIVGDMSSMEREALRTSGGSNLSTLPIHMADMGTDNYEQEFTLGLVETERKLLREINHALAKIQNGSYGICEGTGKPIAKARLEVQPWARYSIEYAKQMERGGGTR